ncbi:hypothetical protein ACI51Z_16360 [Pectobacterium carotovorum]|uniref:hypothetical protein n=1 Tax=Pectobacterium TaxID=122277 RepID=UPI00101DE861|nr:hypothetical protein [Pectobacterium zantedeschiae]RYC37109.1 hypothetical protein DEH81_21690 [Pectobacterium zantedeschiae]
MSPGQRHPSSLSSCYVAGRTSFNIMWHYAKAAERGQRVTNIMSAPFNAWARCGYLDHGVRLAAGVGFLGAVWRTGLRPLLRTSGSFPGFNGVAAFPGGAGSGVNPRPTSTSTEKGLSA